MAKQTFTVGQILTAAQMTDLQQTAMLGGSATAKTTSYTLVAADAGTVVAVNSTSATTITVNTGLFSAGDIVTIQNWGSGSVTITAGTATVNTAGSLIVPQYDGGVLYFTSSSAAIYYDFVQAGAVSPLTTKGDIWVYGSSDTRLPVGTTNQTLLADSTQTTGLKYGSSLQSLMTATGDIVYASSANTPAKLAIGTSGQILSVSSGIPAWTTASSAKIVKVVVVSDTSQNSTTNTTFTTTGLSASITPASTSNTVLVQVLMHGSTQHSGGLTECSSDFALRYTNTTTDLVTHGIATKTGGSAPELTTGVVLGIQHSPASTSSCTYEVFMKSNTGGSNTTTIQRAGSVMILMEVAP